MAIGTDNYQWSQNAAQQPIQLRLGTGIDNQRAAHRFLEHYTCSVYRKCAIQGNVAVAGHQGSEYGSISGLRAVNEYGCQRNCAGNRVRLKGGRQPLRMFSQLAVRHLVVADIDGTARGKPCGRP
jgi:hypothetical protein